MSETRQKFLPDVRGRAVRLVREARRDHSSDGAAICAINSTFAVSVVYGNVQVYSPEIIPMSLLAFEGPRPGASATSTHRSTTPPTAPHSPRPLGFLRATSRHRPR